MEQILNTPEIWSQILHLVLQAATTVGLTELIKDAVGRPAVPPFVWPVVMVAVGIGVSFSELVPPLALGFKLTAFANLAYIPLVKLPKEGVNKLRGKTG